MRFFLFLLLFLPFKIAAFQKYSDDFYTQKIDGRDLTLVMERVKNEASRKLWVNVAWRIQYFYHYYRAQKPRTQWLSKYGNEGLYYFQPLLQGMSDKDAIANNTWVAYITKLENPQPITKVDVPEQRYSHKYDKAPETTTFTQNLMMVMTVRAGPDAPITSHMGIQATIEAKEAGEKGLSMPLHRFAAKVMLDEDPSRVYMINTPTKIAAEIMAKHLPQNAIHMGKIEDLSDFYEGATMTKPSREMLEKYPPVLSVDDQSIKIGAPKLKTTFSKSEHPETYKMLQDIAAGGGLSVVDLSALAGDIEIHEID